MGARSIFEMASGQAKTLLSLMAQGPAVVYGASPSYVAYLATIAAHNADTKTTVVVVSEEEEARQITTDLRFFASRLTTTKSTSQNEANFDPALLSDPVLHIPAADTARYADLASDHSSLMRRLSALYRLGGGPHNTIPALVVVSVSSLLQRVPQRSDFAQIAVTVSHDQDLDRDAFCQQLVHNGFRRAPIVQDPGTFAVRGGVIDVFCPLYHHPVRIELLGDQIESMRVFDPATQHSLRPIEVLHVHQVRETILSPNADPRSKILAAADAASHSSKATREILRQIETGEEFYGIDALTPAFHDRLAQLTTYFPPPERVQWILHHPTNLVETGRNLLSQAEIDFERRRKSEHRLAFPPADHYAPIDAITSLRDQHQRIEFRRLEFDDDNTHDLSSSLRVKVGEHRELSAQLETARKTRADELLRPLVNQLDDWKRKGWRVAIACANSARMERLRSLLAENDIEVAIASEATMLDSIDISRPMLFSSPFRGGFSDASEKFSVLSEDIVFGPRRAISHRQTAARKRALRALSGDIADFSTLKSGDHIVHSHHGIGVYINLVQLPVGDEHHDFLHVQYRDGTLYLPMYRLGEVRCYVGAQGHAPSLDKLGGATWLRKNKSVARDVRGLAEELLQLYAQRATVLGTAFPPSDAMFREFEATFEFDETPDQKRAIKDVLSDMEDDTPMDRLVCGDVGYGKTEVALRAALKAVLGGKQVAVLAPTTVLVEQHYQTFLRRLSGWPVQIAKISRFQPRKQQSQTIVELAKGSLDIVIGTHRLLSKDIRFKQLGLLIVDEEQRFGVTHKERIRKTRSHIDTLTLTATPIPRTLHLAMAGMRDLSIIATPPVDRHSVQTFISQTQDQTLIDGVRRELARRGQVFLVTPHIDKHSQSRSLAEWASHLSTLVPEARVAIAHGRLPGGQLEQTMVDFITGKYNILVSTTIIENGLDIPRANTMFIADAQSFGLAQLYQLRGRIGRGSVKAYCYLLVSHPSLLTQEAQKRLEALQRFSELGSGFQIASYDLELRGAGELFGPRQSGSIAAVGFDSYLALLREAVNQLRGDTPAAPSPEPEMNVAAPGFIPEDYIPDVGQRLGYYKQLSSAEDSEQIATILDDMRDRYGPIREEVHSLADLCSLRVQARRLGVMTLELSKKRLTLALAPESPLDRQKLVDLVNRFDHYRITPDQRLQRTFSPDEQKQPSKVAYACLLELNGCATN